MLAATITTLFTLLIMIAWIYKQTVIIYEFEKGLKFKNGKYIDTLEAGRYFVFSKNIWIRKVGLRPRIMNMNPQDVLSSDGVTLRASVVMDYEVTDPYTAIISTENYDQAVYAAVHAVLREIIGAFKIEEILEVRPKINELLFEQTKDKVTPYGVKFNSIVVKDIMFPGELKKIFTQVIQARKEGLAALEKARGESAALRNLANAAKMIEGNPNLLKLKLLQTTGNTLVLGLDQPFMDMNNKGKK